MRLFIGIELPAEIKKALRDFQFELRQRGVMGFWKSVENLHITLEFLGDVDPNSISVLTKTLSKVASNHKSFILSIGGLGVFPSLKRPHTLWSAIDGNVKEFHALRDNLHNELAKSGFALEERKFRPHITLASRPMLGEISLSEFKTKKIGSLPVTEVVLFESRVMNKKRIYSDSFRASLKS